jgi:geranylgeranyl diphosphate synthase type II
MKDIIRFKDIIEESLQKIDFPSTPKNLYEPIKYILSLEAKRIRSIALLIAHNLYNKDYTQALSAAVAIEMFHNFTLIHDDIMDKASLRRNSKTVHEKWDDNIAILSGDALLVKSYMMLSDINSKTRNKVIDRFSNAAMIVCEGQQMDMDFETAKNISIDDYLIMIEKKTSALFASSFEIGALIGGANTSDQKLIYKFGINLGIAFQLQDDLLDLYGDSTKFGKKVGGDIIANKKTFLYLKSLQLANENQKDELITLYSQNDMGEANKIEKVKAIFNNLNIVNITKKKIDSYHHNAMNCLNKISTTKKDALNYFVELLDKREV